MSVDASLNAACELEARLYGYLRIPLPAPQAAAGAPQQRCSDLWPALERLRLAVADLERSAAGIGAIPRGYPKHIDLVMKIISALLPWYTRSLVEFGRQTAQTAKALSDAVAEVARRQQELAAALQRPPHTHSAPPGRPRVAALDGSAGEA